MVVASPLPTKSPAIATPTASIEATPNLSLEAFLAHPTECTEWVDGIVVEKTGMSFKHGATQSRVNNHWRNHIDASGLGGEGLTETLCRTTCQGRRPDVAYITPELLAQYGKDFTALPQSFPLIAEVVSPDDKAEELFAKAEEYLASGCQEVWLLFPEARLILAKALQQAWRLYNSNDTIATQLVLKGFTIVVNKLFA